MNDCSRSQNRNPALRQTRTDQTARCRQSGHVHTVASWDVRIDLVSITLLLQEDHVNQSRGKRCQLPSSRNTCCVPRHCAISDLFVQRCFSLPWMCRLALPEDVIRMPSSVTISHVGDATQHIGSVSTRCRETPSLSPDFPGRSAAKRLLRIPGS